MWQSLQGEDPKFVPLDEFMSQRLLDQWEQDGVTDPTELVLESEI